MINLASAVTLPVASRLGALRRFAPIEVPEAAAVLVALAGVGLLFLARGVRRGQRHAWSLALALLLVSVAGHVVKGLDVEEATLTLLAAMFLATHPADFAAPGQPVVGAPRATAGLAGPRRSRSRREWSVSSCIARACRSATRSARSALRLFGDRSVALPHLLDRLLSPALLAIGIGIVLSVLWLSFRPAVVGPHDVVPSDVA